MIRRVILLGAAALYQGGILYLSSLPDGGARASLAKQLLFNSAHVPLYGGLALLLFFLFSGESQGEGLRKWPYAMSFVTAGFGGILVEWYQSLIPGRSSSFLDIFLNFSGIILALGLIRYFRAVKSQGLERNCWNDLD